MKPYLITTLNIQHQSISRKVARAKNIKEARDFYKPPKYIKAMYDEENREYPWKVLSVEPVKAAPPAPDASVSASTVPSGSPPTANPAIVFADPLIVIAIS